MKTASINLRDHSELMEKACKEMMQVKKTIYKSQDNWAALISEHAEAISKKHGVKKWTLLKIIS